MAIHLDFLQDSIHALAAAQKAIRPTAPKTPKELWIVGAALRDAHLSLEKLVKHLLSAESELLVIAELKEEALHKAIAAKRAVGSPSLLTGPVALKTHRLDRAWGILKNTLGMPESPELREQVDLTVSQVSGLRNRFQHGEVSVDPGDCAIALEQCVLAVFALLRAVEPNYRELLDAQRKGFTVDLEALEQGVAAAWLNLRNRIDSNGHVDFAFSGFLSTAGDSGRHQLIFGGVEPPNPAPSLRAFQDKAGAIVEGVFGAQYDQDQLDERRREQDGILAAFGNVPRAEGGTVDDSHVDPRDLILRALQERSIRISTAKESIGLPMLQSGAIEFQNVFCWLTMPSLDASGVNATATGVLPSLRFAVTALPGPGQVEGVLAPHAVGQVHSSGDRFVLNGTFLVDSEFLMDEQEAPPQLVRSIKGGVRVSRAK